jgi:hypothetical protein
MSRTLVFQLDDAAPVQVVLPYSTVAAPHVPSRWVRGIAAVSWDAPVGTAAAIEVAVSNVRVAP